MMKFKEFFLKEDYSGTKKITKELESDAAQNIGSRWCSGGEKLLTLDPNIRYIKLTDNMEDQLAIEYDDGALKDCKWNKSANNRIAIKAKDWAINLLRGKKYPLLAAYFNIKPFNF